MMDLDELRLILSLQEVDVTGYSDKQLTKIYEYYERLLDSLLVFSFRVSRYSEYKPDFRGSSVLLGHYPITRVLQVMVNDKPVPVKRVQGDAGLVYFKEPVRGELIVEYRSGWSEDRIQRLIEPLIVDLISYGFKYGRDGLISSLHEGDVSVTYDTSNGLVDVQSRIKDLNRRYGTHSRML